MPRLVDPRKLAQQGVTLSGMIALADLPRLCEMILDHDHRQLTTELIFGVDENVYYMKGRLSIELPVTCQRCLDPMNYQLDLESSLAMLWSEEYTKNLEQSWDPWVVGEGQTDIYAVLEDELILSLPHVTYHSEPCVAEEKFSSGEDVAESHVQQPNPFDVLADLKGTLNKPTSNEE